METTIPPTATEIDAGEDDAHNNRRWYHTPHQQTVIIILTAVKLPVAFKVLEATAQLEAFPFVFSGTRARVCAQLCIHSNWLRAMVCIVIDQGSISSFNHCPRPTSEKPSVCSTLCGLSGVSNYSSPLSQCFGVQFHLQTQGTWKIHSRYLGKGIVTTRVTQCPKSWCES